MGARIRWGMAVCIKSGGPRMLVVDILLSGHRGEGRVICAYKDRNTIVEVTMNTSVLEPWGGADGGRRRTAGGW